MGLSESDLKNELEVHNLGDRRRLMVHISDLQAQTAPRKRSKRGKKESIHGVTGEYENDEYDNSEHTNSAMEVMNGSGARGNTLSLPHASAGKAIGSLSRSLNLSRGSEDEV